MARIRTIKPDAWHDEALGQCSRDARLLWTALITMSDDEGRFRATPSIVHGHAYPYDLEALGLLPGWLAELAGAHLIVLYGPEIAGSPTLGAHPRWADHQRINKPTPSRLPSPPDFPRETPGSSGVPQESPISPGKPHPHVRAAVRAQDMEVEGDKEEDTDTAGAGDEPGAVVVVPPVAEVSPEAGKVIDTLNAVGLPFHDPLVVERLISEFPQVDPVQAAIRCAAWMRSGSRRVRHPYAALKPFLESDDAPTRQAATDRDRIAAKYANVRVIGGAA